jgi:hypothetical protein
MVSGLKVAATKNTFLPSIAVPRISFAALLHSTTSILIPGVLGGSTSFTLRSIMIHARLAIPRTIDGIPLAEFDLVQFVQLIDLPSDESVVVRVCIGRQEHAPPIDTCTKGFQVTLSQN